jgi:uncharacterized NAD-dependent epimerase/dehydratase family protein
VRGTDRYRVLGVVDPPTAGRDAGEVLDGIRRGIPIFASLPEALAALPDRPDYAIVGIATHGGRMIAGIRASLQEALENGLSVVNGLHEFASDDRELVRLAKARGRTITDVRKVPPRSDLHFWTGRILEVAAPRIAVLGTDCAIGKRTTNGARRARNGSVRGRRSRRPWSQRFHGRRSFPRSVPSGSR